MKSRNWPVSGSVWYVGHSIRKELSRCTHAHRTGRQDTHTVQQMACSAIAVRGASVLSAMKHIGVLSLVIVISLPLGCSRKQGNISPVKVEVQRVEQTKAAKTIT